MGPDPAMRAKVHGDAGREQGDADGEGARDPGKFDAALQDEEIQYSEDQHQHSSLGEERGAAPGGDDGEVKHRGHWLGILRARRDQAETCGIRGRSEIVPLGKDVELQG